MLSIFQRQWIKRCVAALSCFKVRLPRKRRWERQRLTVEQLEDRVTPAAISWTGNAGTLNWGDMGNWSTSTVLDQRR